MKHLQERDSQDPLEQEKRQRILFPGFNPKEYVNETRSLKDVENYKEIFDFLDDDFDGILTAMDIRKLIRQYGGYKTARPFVYSILYNFEDNGQCSFEEFLRLVSTKQRILDEKEDIERVFECFDEDGKGFISEQDLELAAEELNIEITKEDVMKMMDACDSTNEGKISFEAFIAFNQQEQYD